MKTTKEIRQMIAEAEADKNGICNGRKYNEMNEDEQDAFDEHLLTMHVLDWVLSD